MANVQLHTQAPDFVLKDFRGQTITLSDFRGDRHVLLVLNRGFL